MVSYCQSVVELVSVYSNINIKNSYKNRVIFWGGGGGGHQKIILDHGGEGRGLKGAKKDHIIVERSLIQILSLECVFQRINTPDNYSKVDFTINCVGEWVS